MKPRTIAVTEHSIGAIVLSGQSQLGQVENCYFLFLGNVLSYIAAVDGKTLQPTQAATALRQENHGFVEIEHAGLKVVFWLALNIDEYNQWVGTVSVARRHPLDGSLVEVPAAAFRFNSEGLTNLSDTIGNALVATNRAQAILIYGDVLQAALRQPIGFPKKYE